MNAINIIQISLLIPVFIFADTPMSLQASSILEIIEPLRQATL